MHLVQILCQIKELEHQSVCQREKVGTKMPDQWQHRLYKLNNYVSSSLPLLPLR